MQLHECVQNQIKKMIISYTCTNIYVFYMYFSFIEMFKNLYYTLYQIHKYHVIYVSDYTVTLLMNQWQK